MGILEILIHFVVISIPLAYFAIKYRYNYWKKRGVYEIEGVFPYGSFKDLSLLRGLNSKYYEAYDFLSKSFLSGIFIFLNPVAVPTEPKLVEKILKDSADHFEVEDFNLIETDDYQTANTFLFEDKKWAYLKEELVPKYISHIEPLVPEMAEIGKRVAQSFRAAFKILPDSKVGNFTYKYAIGSTGYSLFGMRSIGVENPESSIYMSEKPGVPNEPKNNLLVFAGKFYKFCTRRDSGRDKFRVPHDAQVFYNAIKETVERRINQNEKKNDIIDLLIKAKNNSNQLTVEEIVQQAFLLFVAFHETTSTLMTLALYELAINNEVQDKVRQEIRDVVKKNNGQITYQTIMKMSFLDQIVNETLRKYPPVPNLYRKTIKEFTWAPNRTIEKGISMIIPIGGMQMNHNIYEYPEIFDPERFSPETLRKMDRDYLYSFLPFGEKNEKNIGYNVVKIQVLIGLALMLENFKYLFCQRTHIPLEVSKKTLVMTVKDEIILRVKEI